MCDSRIREAPRNPQNGFCRICVAPTAVQAGRRMIFASGHAVLRPHPSADPPAEPAATRPRYRSGTSGESGVRKSALLMMHSVSLQRMSRYPTSSAGSKARSWFRTAERNTPAGMTHPVQITTRVPAGAGVLRSVTSSPSTRTRSAVMCCSIRTPTARPRPAGRARLTAGADRRSRRHGASGHRQLGGPLRLVSVNTRAHRARPTRRYAVRPLHKIAPMSASRWRSCRPAVVRTGRHESWNVILKVASDCALRIEGCDARIMLLPAQENRASPDGAVVLSDPGERLGDGAAARNRSGVRAMEGLRAAGIVAGAAGLTDGWRVRRGSDVGCGGVIARPVLTSSRC